MTAAKRIVLLANTDWYLWNFRLDLARALRGAGHRVGMVCPPGDYVARLRDEGFRVHTFTAPADGFSIAANRRALAEITRAFRALRPEVVHLFTPVCVLLGSMAAHRLRVPYRIAALTGLGHVFTSDSLKARAARPGLRWLFRRELSRPGTAVVFQNEADRDELVAAGVVRAGHCHLVRGSGVDPGRFQPRAQPRGDAEVRILFASRLLREKGLHELLAAFEKVSAACPQARLWVAGEIYPPNPTSLTAEEVRALGSRPGVEFLGHVEDMPSLLGQVDIVALPSYREGTPKILLEAAACGLPIVATDIAGCRGVVQQALNGYLVPPRSVGPLADALTRLAQDPQLRIAMGREGREIVLREFSSDIVVRRTLEVYRALVSEPAAA